MKFSLNHIVSLFLQSQKTKTENGLFNNLIQKLLKDKSQQNHSHHLQHVSPSPSPS